MIKFTQKYSIELHRVLKSCADATISIFLPILIYSKTQSLQLTFLYLTLNYLMWGLFNIAIKKLIYTRPILLIVLHVLPFIAIQFIVAFVQMNVLWVIFTAILSALGSVLYSVPINIIFASHDKKINVSKFDSSAIIGKIIFTFITAYLIGTGFKESLVLVVVISSILYSLSAMPLLINYKNIKHSAKELQPQNIGKTIKENKQYNLMFAAFGIFQTVMNVVLPLFLFVYDFKIEKIAIIIILADLIKIASNYFAKYLVSKNKASLSLTIAGVLFFISCVSLPFVQNALYYYIISLILPLTFPLVHVPLFSNYIKKLKQEDNLLTGLLVRDIFILTPRSFLLYVFYFALNSFTPLFFIGGLSCLVLVINKKILKNKTF